MLNHNGICAKQSSLHVTHNPVLFASSITECTHISHAAMVMGSTTIDDSGCEMFLKSALSQFESSFLTLAAVTAGRSRGVSAEHLAKVWMIPHNEAARTIQVTPQCLRTDIDSSLSRNIGTTNCAVLYCHIKLCFYTDTLFVTGAAKSSRFVQNDLSRTKDMLQSIPCNINKIIFWPSSSLLRMLVPQTFSSVIPTLHKSKERSRNSVHKLVQHSKSLKLRLSGLTGLSLTLALLRRL